MQHLAMLTPSVEKESVETLLSSDGRSLIVVAQPGGAAQPGGGG